MPYNPRTHSTTHVCATRHLSPTTANLGKCVLRGVSAAAAFETFNKAPACSYIMDCTQLVSLRNSSGERPASQVSAKAKSNGSHQQFLEKHIISKPTSAACQKKRKIDEGRGHYKNVQILN